MMQHQKRKKLKKGWHKKWAQILCGGNFLVTPSIPKELGLQIGLLSLIRITAAEVDDT